MGHVTKDMELRKYILLGTTLLSVLYPLCFDIVA